MAKFKTELTYSVAFPVCQSSNIKRDGTQSGEQRYRCKEEGCQKKFRASGKAPGRKVDAEIMGAAIEDYYRGKSFKAIAETLSREYDMPEPSKATIYEWVRDYTDKAVDQMDGVEPTLGDHWVADEMQVDAGGGPAWLWNVMDGETRYILATHLTRDRDGKAATIVLMKALKAAGGKPPDSFFSDKLRSYRPALRTVLPDARHMQSEGLTADINNNLSERLQGTFRDRIKTLRGLDSIESGQRYLDGWTLNYNLFKKHHSLRNRTPAQAAKVKAPFTEWADVVRDGKTIKPRLVKAGPVVRQEAVKVVPEKVVRMKDPKAQPAPTRNVTGQVRHSKQASATHSLKIRNPAKRPAWLKLGELQGRRRKAVRR